ncbi:MAG: Cd(II)/Pb(II)-responsive transcriptional regulator [Pseudomonas sp.]
MKIGELANAAKCTTETVRFYEKEGLLPETERTGSNYRSYHAAHLERLRFIRNCRALDMTHEEIRALLAVMDLPADGCGAVNTLLDKHIGHVDARIEELLQLKRQLSDLRQQCQTEQAPDSCGILRGLASMETETSSERHTHLG